MPIDGQSVVLIDDFFVVILETTTDVFFFTVGKLEDFCIVVCRFFNVEGKFLEYRLAMLTFGASIAVKAPFASSSLVSSDFVVSLR